MVFAAPKKISSKTRRRCDFFMDQRQYLQLIIKVLKILSQEQQMKEDISCVFEGVAGVGGIYISNLKAAQNLPLLNSLGIKAIVTAVRNGIVQHDKSDITDHLYVPADDHQAYDLARHFNQTYNFIDSVRKRTNVLVHCYAGISRSATIVIAYLLRKYNYSLEKVITMVKRRRNKINPNRGFIQQLKKQAAKKGIEDTLNQVPIQEVLQKLALSPEKKRSLSTYSRNRGKNVQTVDPKQQIISFYRVNQNQEIIRNSSLNIPKQNKTSVNNFVKLSAEMLPSSEQMHSRRQKSQNLSDKIEKLKSKVLESEKRRKSQQKRPNLEYKTRQLEIKLSKSGLQSILSAKLNKNQPIKHHSRGKQTKLSLAQNSHINKITFNQSSVVF